MRRRLALFISILFIVAIIGGLWAFHALAAPPANVYYYLSPWEWYEELDTKGNPTGFDYWRCPAGDCTGTLDLRSIPEMSIAGGVPQGYGIFTYDAVSPRAAKDGVLLANRGTAIPTVAVRMQIEARLKLNSGVVGDTIDDIIWDLYVNHADPTGASAWKPLRCSQKSGAKLHLAGRLIHEEACTIDSPTFANTVAVFQADYAVLRVTVSETQRQKVVGAEMQSLWGRMGDDLLEPLLGPYASDGWAKPSTLIHDDFNRSDRALDGDTATFGGASQGWTWKAVTRVINIVSQVASLRTATGPHDYRAEADLSSADHYAQVDVVTLDEAEENSGGALARFDPAARTYYRSVIIKRSGTEYAELWSVVASSFSRIDLDAITISLPNTVKCEADGTTISTYIDGVLKNQVTNSDISGYLRTGIGGDIAGSAGDAGVDNFEADDLGGTPTPTPTPFMYGYVIY